MLASLLLGLSCFQSELSQTKPARATATALRIAIEEAPAIDGDLTDPVWDKVPPVGEFVQREPAVGALPSERTIIKIAHDGKLMYIAIYCYDSEPALIRDTQIRRDANLDPDDRVEFVFDTLHDHRNAYFFQIGPGGSIGDALIAGNGSNFNKSWDGIWRGRAKVTDEGWFAELAIPFRTVVTSDNITNWGMNIARFIRRKNEECVWSNPSYDRGIFRISEAGDLLGMDRLDHGIGLDVVPYARSSFINHHRTDDQDLLATAGGEAFYRLTRGITAAFTVNTDFAETEADERRVNLTRFPLFFPEKRKFFLEDAGVFHFDGGGGGFGGSSDLIPFFSRRIGLGPNGSAIPIQAGAKISGYEGPWSIGLLGVNTRERDNLDSRDLAAGRVRYNIDRNNTIGGIFTSGDPAADAGNELLGFDYRYSTSELSGDKTLDVRAFALESFTKNSDGNNRAMGAEVSYPNDLFRWRARAREIGDEFNPALGFVSRTGIRSFDGELSFRPRPNTWIRQVSFSLFPRVITDLSGSTQDAALRLLTNFEFESGEEMELFVRPSFEHVEFPFDIVPNANIPSGNYSDVRHGFEFSTSDKREFSGGVGFENGKKYDGSQTDVREFLAWRPGGLLQIAADSEQNFLRFPGGTKDVLVGRIKTEFNFSPDVSWETLFQFDNVSKGAGVNSRMRYIVDPAKDIFVVFNHNWIETASRAVVADTTSVIIKVVFTLRF